MNKGDIVQATGYFSHAEEVEPYLRLGDVPDRSGSIVKIPVTPRFVEINKVPVYMAAYTLDLINYSYSELDLIIKKDARH